MRIHVAIALGTGVLCFFGGIRFAQTAIAQTTPEAPADCNHQVQQARDQLTQDTNDPIAQTALGDALACMEDWNGAIAAYQAVLTQSQTGNAAPDSFNGEVVSTYFKLAQVFVKANQLDQALATYRQAITIDPMYGYLIGLFDDRQYSPLGEPVTDGSIQGEGNAAPVVADRSIEASAYFELGKALDAADRWPEAIDAYQQAIRLSPSFAHAYNALGQALFQMDRFEEAKVAYEKAIQLNPEFVWAYYNLGYLMTWQTEPEQGFADFRRVVDLHTGLDTLGPEIKDAIAYSLVGDVSMKQGNPNPAIDAYQQAIKLSPQDGSLNLRLGKALLARGDAEPAITAFRQAIDLLPEWAIEQQTEAYLGIGRSFIQLEDWTGAKVNLEKALSLSPDSTVAQELLDDVRTR